MINPFLPISRAFRVHLFLLIILSHLILMNSCVKNYLDSDKIADSDWNPEVAFPLVFSKLSIADIIAKAEVQSYTVVDNTNFVSIFYKGKGYSISVQELLRVPPQYFGFALPLLPQDISTLQNTGSVSAEQQVSFPVSLENGAQLDSVKIKSGRIRVTTSSDFRHNTTFTLTFPGLKKNGEAYSRSFTMNYSGSLPVSSYDQRSLEGYTLELGNGLSQFNDLRVNLKLNIESTGNPVSGTETVQFNVAFEDLEYSSVFGYFGQPVVNIAQDSVKIEIFNNAISGNFNFVDPRAKIILGNSIGLPVRGDFISFQSYSPYNGTLNITGAPSPLFINSPSIYQIGQTQITNFYLNNGNSNITAAINSKLSPYIAYEFNGIGNPSGAIVKNFATDTSKVFVDVEVELPLYGSFSEFVLQDTFDFRFEKEANNVMDATFRLNVDNGFPVDAYVQLIFADENYNYLDSLVGLPQQLIKSGIIGIDGKVTQQAHKMSDFLLDEAKLQKIAPVKKILVRAMLETSNIGSTPVKIYSDYRFTVRLGVKSKLKIFVSHQ